MSAQLIRNKKRFWIWAVTFVVLMALLGASWGWVSNQALGLEPTDPAPASVEVAPDVAQTGEQCCSQDVRRWARKAAKRFRKGKIHRDHGFRPGAIFRAPRKARRVWINKIHRWVLNHPGHLRSLAPRTVHGRTCYPTSTCYAAGLYDDAVHRSSCVTGSYPAATQGACDRAPWHNGPGLTKAQIQRGGAVTLCGTGVALGVVTAPPTGGLSVFLSAFVGSVTCGWAFWSSMD